MEITEFVFLLLEVTGALGSLVLSVCTIFIVARNLCEQIALNKAQFKLLEIEANRSSREIRPLFTFDNLSTESIVKFKVNLTRNIALDVNYRAFGTDDLTEVLRFTDLKPVGKVYNPGHLFTLQWVVKPGHERMANISIFLEFTDEDGNPYEQVLFYDAKDNKLNDMAALRLALAESIISKQLRREVIDYENKSRSNNN